MPARIHQAVIDAHGGPTKMDISRSLDCYYFSAIYYCTNNLNISWFSLFINCLNCCLNRCVRDIFSIKLFQYRWIEYIFSDVERDMN